MTDEQAYILNSRLQKAMDFLCRGIEFHRGRGISHSYSFWLNPVKGWHESYPEVTGYAIPTLLSTSRYHNTVRLEGLAMRCAEWLLSIQHEDGWFYSGVKRSQGPSFFNSAMILFGLDSAYQFFGEEKYLDAMEKTLVWMESIQESDGAFLKHAYSEAFQPAYYSRAAWAIKKATRRFEHRDFSAMGERLVLNLKPYFLDDRILNCGFHRDEGAFLHTVAYALRGGMECNRFKKDDFNLSFLNVLMDKRQSRGVWPGRIAFRDTGVEYDFSFRCLTGEAQMSILLLLTENQAWHDIAESTILDLMKFQGKTGPKRGGLPGSSPLWGAYMKWRYPTWATKFYVDAIQLVLDKVHF